MPLGYDRSVVEAAGLHRTMKTFTAIGSRAPFTTNPSFLFNDKKHLQVHVFCYYRIGITSLRTLSLCCFFPFFLMLFFYFFKVSPQ